MHSTSFFIYLILFSETLYLADTHSVCLFNLVIFFADKTVCPCFNVNFPSISSSMEDTLKLQTGVSVIVLSVSVTQSLSLFLILSLCLYIHGPWTYPGKRPLWRTRWSCRLRCRVCCSLPWWRSHTWYSRPIARSNNRLVELPVLCGLCPGPTFGKSWSGPTAKFWPK